MFSRLGACVVTLGVMSADSIDILLPVIVIAIGAVLVAVGEWRGEK